MRHALQMKPLNRQQQIVYSYIEQHPGCTAREITDSTKVDARARMAEMRGMGLTFKVVGYKQLSPRSKPFKQYALEEKMTADEWFESLPDKQAV